MGQTQKSKFSPIWLYSNINFKLFQGAKNCPNFQFCKFQHKKFRQNTFTKYFGWTKTFVHICISLLQRMLCLVNDAHTRDAYFFSNFLISLGNFPLEPICLNDVNFAINFVKHTQKNFFCAKKKEKEFSLAQFVIYLSHAI